MVLKKTLRVWKSYKGLLGFAGAYLLMMILFVFTGFFGFESRVPDEDNITGVAVYDYYFDNEIYIENDEVIKENAYYRDFLTITDCGKVLFLEARAVPIINDPFEGYLKNI